MIVAYEVVHVAWLQFFPMGRLLINPAKKFRRVSELIVMHVGRLNMWFGDNFCSMGDC